MQDKPGCFRLGLAFSMALLVQVVTGCAHVEVVEQVTREPIEVQERVSPPLGKPTYEAKCEYPKPTLLRCQITAEDVCERSKVEIIERRVVEERTTETWVKVLEWVSAGVVLPIGVLVTVDAGYIPDGSNPLDTNPVGQTGAYAIGGSLTAIGAGLLALAITDSVRAMDEVKEVANEEKVLEASLHPCNKKPFADRRITVRLPPLEHEFSTDVNGVLTLDLEVIAPSAEILASPNDRILVLSAGNKEVARMDLRLYVEQVQKLEAARKRQMEEWQKRLTIFAQEADAVVARGPSEDCVGWHATALELSRKDASAVSTARLASLADCAAGHLIGLATKQYEAGMLSEGTATLERAEALRPGHPDRARAFDARVRGINHAVSVALQGNRIQAAKDLLTKCRQLNLAGAVCTGIDQDITRAAVIESSAIGQLKGIRGILLALPSPKVSKSLLDNLVKGLAVRSGSLPGVEWTPTDSVIQALPKEQAWLKQCFGEADCALGILKQFGSNLLVVLSVTPKGKRFEIEERWFQVAGCTLESSTQRFEVGAEELQGKSWEILKGQLSAGTSRVQVCQPVESEEVKGDGQAKPGEGQAGGDGATEMGPYSNFDLETLFATDEDVLPPPSCTPVLTDSPAANAPGEGGVFKRPRVLLLDLEVKVPGGLKPSDKWLAQAALKHTLMNTFRMKRNDYVLPCEKVNLDSLRGNKLYGVDFVFHLALLSWKEETSKETGELTGIETKIVLRVWDVREGTWKEYLDTDMEVPSWLDRGVFMAEDTKKQAIDKAVKDTGLEKGVELVADSVLKAAGGRVQPKLDDPKKNWYVYKLKQSLGMSGKKLAVEVAKQKDFRLSSPIVSREDDEVAMALGEREGVRLCDTYLFSRNGPDDWEGFGRVNHIGMGGAEGTADPSKVEVIADYEGKEAGVTVFEYPVVGIVAGLSFGLMPVKHDGVDFETGDSVGERVVGMPGLGLDVRWRIPWLPITELYLSNRFTYIIDPPVVLFTIDPGFEWRWFWGRFAPVIGLRYSLGIIGIPVETLSGEKTTATAVSHGLEPYLGFYIFIHPAWTMSLHAGWRQYFSQPSTFKKDGVKYQIRPDGGDHKWGVDLSGPFAVLGFTYEY